MTDYNFFTKVTDYVEERYSLLPSSLSAISMLYDERLKGNDYFYEIYYPYRDFETYNQGDYNIGVKTVSVYQESICLNPTAPWRTEIVIDSFDNYVNHMLNVTILEKDIYYKSNKFISPLAEKVVKRQDNGAYITYNINYEEVDRPYFKELINKDNSSTYCFATEKIKYFRIKEDDIPVIYKVHLDLLTQKASWYRNINQTQPQESECITYFRF